MAVVTNGYGGLITGGLGLPGCQGMIVNVFHVVPCVAIFVAGPGGGGGPYPGPAWNKTGDIQNFYQPVLPEQQPYHIPMDKEADYFRKTKIITVDVNIKGMHVEKTYSVSEHTANRVVSVLNLLNVTRDRMGVKIQKLKKVATRAFVAIKNLRLRNR